MKKLKWIYFVSSALFLGALHLSLILKVTFNLSISQLEGLSASDIVEVLAYITSGFSKRQIVYLGIQGAGLSFLYLVLITLWHLRKRAWTIGATTVIAGIFLYQVGDINLLPTSSLPSRDIPRLRNPGAIQTFGSPLSNKALKSPLPDIYFFLLESVRGDHFNETHYPKTLSILRQIPSWGAADGKSSGTETAISIPRILHGVNNPGSQLFSCETSLLGNLHQSGYQNYVWSSQSYEWRELKNLLRCAPTRFTGIKQIRAQAKLQSKDSDLEEGLYRLPNAVDDEFTARLFLSHLDKPETQAPQFHLVHFYNTHYPYLGNSSRAEDSASALSYSTLEELFQTTATEQKRSLATHYRKQYQASLKKNDQHLSNLLRVTLEHSQRKQRPIVIVITSDHGEEFGEHGEILHSSQTSPFETLTQIPIYFASTDITIQSRFSKASLPHWVGHIDIAPTLYDLLSLKRNIVGDGKSLLDSSPRYLTSLSQGGKGALFHYPHKILVDLPQQSLTGFKLAEDPNEGSPLPKEQVQKLFDGIYQEFQPSLRTLLQARKSLIIAHRGDHRFLPENSGAAFLLARQGGADGVELDTRLTRDGKAIVFHDEKFQGIQGELLNIQDSTLAEIRSRSRNAQGVLTLEQALSQIHQGVVIIEMKVENGVNPALLNQVGKLILKYGLENRALASSVNLHQASAFKTKFPQLNTLFELHGVSPEQATKIASRIPVDRERTFVSFSKDLLSEKLIQIIGERFAGSSIFTPNSEEDLLRALKAGINLIQTDEPHRLWEQRLQAMGQSSTMSSNL